MCQFFRSCSQSILLGGNNTFIKSANLETSTKWKMSVFEQKPSIFFSSQKAIKTEMWKVFSYRAGLFDLTPPMTGCSRLCVLRSWRSYCPIPRKAQNWRWIGFIDHGSRIGGTTRSRNWGRDTKSFFPIAEHQNCRKNQELCFRAHPISQTRAFYCPKLGMAIPPNPI